MKYRPDIDGLRAFAVISVILYHSGLGLSGGFIGVDVFFVISGYLITELLQRRILEERFSYQDFWIRRIRRLVPALAVMNVATTIVANIVLLPDDLADFGGALLSQPLLLANCYYWRVVKGGYFSDPPETRPLLHTWSLGVEEQFYLIFPLLLAWIHRGILRHHSKKILATTFCLSLLLSILLTPTKPVLSFFTLPTRMWELLAGSLIAGESFGSRHKTGRKLCSIIGLALMCASLFILNEDTNFPGYKALFPTIGCALFIVAGPDAPGNRAFSNKPLTQIGRLSYSLYLWHWPIFAATLYLGFVDFKSRWLCIVATAALGYFSYILIEKPVREVRVVKERSALLLATALYGALCIFLGLAFIAREGYPHRFMKIPVRPRLAYFLRVDPTENSAPMRLLGSHSEKPSFLLWGDSHAMALAPVFDQLASQLKIQGLQLTREGTPPLLDYLPKKRRLNDPEVLKTGWRNLALSTVRTNNIRTVFLAAYWDFYDEDNMRIELPKTIATLRAAGVKPVVLLDVPKWSHDPYRQVPLHTRWNFLPPPMLLEEARADQNRWLKSLLGENIDCLDPSPLLRNLSPDGFPYSDSNHITLETSRKLAPMLRPTLENLVNSLPR